MPVFAARTTGSLPDRAQPRFTNADTGQSDSKPAVIGQVNDPAGIAALRNVAKEKRFVAIKIVSSARSASPSRGGCMDKSALNR
jgi:hypothetical protein